MWASVGYVSNWALANANANADVSWLAGWRSLRAQSTGGWEQVLFTLKTLPFA